MNPIEDFLDPGSALLRTGHVASAILWLAPQFYFGFIAPHAHARLTAPLTRAFDLEITPRLLAWYRWGAALTWMLGFVLLFLTYFRTTLLLDVAGADPFELQRLLGPDGRPTPNAWIPGFLALIAGFAVYEALARVFAKGVARHAVLPLWFALAIAGATVLDRHFHHSGRALFIELGAMTATLMAANVWMHIWPAERRSWLARRAGGEPAAVDLELSRTRGRHNALATMPLLFLMLSNHHPSLYSGSLAPWPIAAGTICALGIVATFPLDRLARLTPQP